MLKLPLYGLLSMAFFAASSASATTLLTKTSSPGYVMKEFALYTTCTLDDSGAVTIKNQLNGLSSKKTTMVQISTPALKNAIAIAAKGKIKKPEAMIADAPVTVYSGYEQPVKTKIKKIFLYEDHGNINESPAALTLRNFMDAVCK